MAIPTVQIQGKVLTPSGAAPLSGTITAELSAPGSVLDGASSVRVAAKAVGRIGAGGAVAEVVLVPNDQVVPSGTSYRVTFSVRLPNGRDERWSEVWHVASAPSPVEIGAVPRLDVTPGVAVTTAPAVAQAAADAQASATAAASAAAGSAASAEAAQAAVEAGTAQITPTGATTPHALKDYGTHLVTPGTTGPVMGRNIVANPDQNAIAGDVHTATITGGGAPGFSQRIGSSPGSNASYSTIGGGYDNTNDQIAGTIAGGAHHVLEATGTHGTVGGGSYHTIGAGVEYAVIPGGTNNEISGAGDVGTIGGGQNNTLTGPGCVIAGGTNNSNGGNVAVIGGGNSNSIADTNGAGCVIGGGTQQHIDGTGTGYNTIGGGTANAISGVTKGTIAGGATNTVTGNFGTICGGDTNTASAAGAAVVGGFSNAASGQYSTVVNGQQNQAAADYATVTGLRGKATLYAQQVLAGGYFAAAGDAETFQLILRRQTADANATSMALDGAGALAVLPDNTSWAFSILIVARNTGANEHAAYEFKGLIKRDSGVATTALVGAVTKTVVAETVAAWDANVTADTTSGDLRIRVTGETGKTIRWVAHVRVAAVGQ
jgi:hypothetical protein